MTGLVRSRAVGILLVAASGALLLSTLGRTISLFESTEQPVLWWAGRASGFLAYLAMWLSMVFGTLVSAKSELLNKKLTMELHRQWSLAAVVATLVHVVVLVAHPDSGLSLLAGVVPFLAERLTGGVALGVFSLWGLVLVIGSSLLQRRMPYAAWRAIHALSFGAMLLALVHGVVAGTDTSVPLVRGLYAVTTAVLAGAIAGRITSSVLASRGDSDVRAVPGPV